MNALIATKISKKYRRKVVLNEVDVTINPGEIVGLLGLNGVGKTTLLKILSGVSNSYSGKVIYNNKDINKANKLTEVMMVPDEIIIPKHLTIRQIEEIFIQKNEKYKSEYLNNFLDKLNIDSNMKIRTLSKGNRELAQLGLFLANCPEFIILDEPLAAVDVLKRDTVLDLLIDLQSDGVAIILSTHLIKDIEGIMSRILLLKDGKIVADTDIEEIQCQNIGVQEYILSYVGGVWEN